MLKKITVEELSNVLALFAKDLKELMKSSSGIIKNELKAKYETEADRKNQQRLKECIDEIEEKLIANINQALKVDNTQNLRSELVNFFDAIKGIFQASLDIHLAHDFDQEKGERRALGYYFDHEQSDKQAKGRYFEILRNLINSCEETKKIVLRDHDIKGEFGHLSTFTSALNTCVRSLGEILGYKMKESKGEKIEQLVKPPKTFHEEYLSPYEQRRTSPK